MSTNQKILASCLFEAIDDVNFSNVMILLEKHGTDPNTIIPKLRIAPIHYAVGFGNLDFAEKVTEVFLKKNANPNLYSEVDRLTPLHIACIWGRANIVRMLLKHGGDLDLKCSEDRTPILHAIAENHFEVIEVIKMFLYEQKMSKRAPLVRTISQQTYIGSPMKNISRINHNFDVTSPYYINITHRRHNSSQDRMKSARKDLNDAIENQTDDSTSDDHEDHDQKNLFELTEENLKEFSKKMSKVVIVSRLAIHKQESYIKSWREKIQQLCKYDKLDASYTDFLNNCNDSNIKDVNNENKVETASSADSFVTAETGHRRNKNQIETKQDNVDSIQKTDELCKKETNEIVGNSENNLSEDAVSITTKVSIPPSLDYNTDVLRSELRNITGDNPGPITKNTKRLYLKQLLLLKKKIKKGEKCERNERIVYSNELQRTINNYDHLEESISDFQKLEQQMSQHFIEHAHIKWREGKMKTSFIYILIDPRLSCNLPLQYKEMHKCEIWKIFLSSIFYVGKGKQSRPYSHLYDAIKLFSKENDEIAYHLEQKKITEKRMVHSNGVKSSQVTSPNGIKCLTNDNKNLQESKKLKRIIDIWKSDMGVICLHIFNNIIPCEAYTREAAIIEAVGIENLTNLKKGEYYGVAKNFLKRKKRQLGIALLYRAMNIYLAEGESRLMPFDLI